MEACSSGKMHYGPEVCLSCHAFPKALNCIAKANPQWVARAACMGSDLCGSVHKSIWVLSHCYLMFLEVFAPHQRFCFSFFLRPARDPAKFHFGATQLTHESGQSFAPPPHQRICIPPKNLLLVPSSSSPFFLLHRTALDLARTGGLVPAWI